MSLAATALALAALGPVATPPPAPPGLGLSASPERLVLEGRSHGVITLRNPAPRPVLLTASRAGFALSLRGRPGVGPSGRDTRWLRLHPTQLRLPAHGEATIRVAATPPTGATPGDHAALVLLTTRPVGDEPVHVRLRIGIVVVLRVPGRIVHRLVAEKLTVRRRGRHRVLELRLANRGNTLERITKTSLGLALYRRGRRIATLRPRRTELLEHSVGIVQFLYRGRTGGTVIIRLRAKRSTHLAGHTYRLRL